MQTNQNSIFYSISISFFIIIINLFMHKAFEYVYKMSAM